MNNNKITSIPDTIGNCVNLKTLGGLYMNRIKLIHTNGDW